MIEPTLVIDPNVQPQEALRQLLEWNGWKGPLNNLFTEGLLYLWYPFAVYATARVVNGMIVEAGLMEVSGEPVWAGGE